MSARLIGETMTSGKQQKTLNLSDLSASLTVAAAGLSAEDRAGLVHALEDKLHSLAYSDVLENLAPKVSQGCRCLGRDSGKKQALGRLIEVPVEDCKQYKKPPSQQVMG